MAREQQNKTNKRFADVSSALSNNKTVIFIILLLTLRKKSGEKRRNKKSPSFYLRAWHEILREQS